MAFKQQRGYLWNKVVKPFSVSVDASFRRVDMIDNLMEFFSPPHSHEGLPSQAHWNNFKEMKKLSEDLKKEIKYNLLLQFFHDCF